MISKALHQFTLLLLLGLLSSCLTITTGLDHQSSGKGSLSLDYRIDKKAAGIQKDSVSGDNLIPLPLGRSDFDELTALISSVSLTSYSESEDTEYIYIEAELSYENLNDLSQFLGFPVEYSSTGNVDTLTLSIYESDQSPDSDTLSIINSLFINDTLSFELRFPRNIRTSSYGTVDGRTVRFESALPDIYQQNNFVWTVEW